MRIPSPLCQPPCNEGEKNGETGDVHYNITITFESGETSYVLDV